MTDPDKDTALVERLREARGAIDAMDQTEREPLMIEIVRVGKVLGYAESIVADADIDLVTLDSRGGVEQALIQLRDTPAAALDGHDATSALLVALAGYPAFQGQQTKEAISDLAGTFQRSSSQRLNALEANFEDRETAVRASFDSLAKEVTGLREEADARSSDFEQQIVELQAAITSAKQSAVQLVSEEQQLFRTEQNDRDAEFKNQRDEAETELKELRQAQDDAGREHLTRLARLEEQSAELAGKVATNTTAGHFLNEADKEAKHAFWWRIVTFSLGLGAVVATFLAAVAEHPDLGHVLAKVAVAGAFGAVATFTARQSTNHRLREKNLRDLQLQLSAFEPIIRRLGDSAGERETVVLIRKLFGQPYGEAPTERELPPDLQVGDQQAA